MRVSILGSGFSSLSAACYLAKAGCQVEIYEKNTSIGGRARRWEKDGFRFDLGPSWYWMPDVFERFFADFGKKPSDYYHLDKLNPAYSIYYGKDDVLTLPDNLEDIYILFEKYEKGAARKLKGIISIAKENYDIAMCDLVYKPGNSIIELITPRTITKLNRFVTTITQQVKREFKNPKLVKLLEFPVLFLGAKPSETPSFYNFMNYADFGLGTWHPKGGIYQIVKAIESLAKSLGVKIYTGKQVVEIKIKNRSATHIVFSDNDKVRVETCLSGADYYHTEKLLLEKYRQYSNSYWKKKIFAPSSLLFYVGLGKKIKNITHHTLFFDRDLEEHAEAIYETKRWPKEPLFYISAPSITDDSISPKGCEALIFLVPIAPGLDDTEQIREQYFKSIIERFEKLTNQSVSSDILFKKSYCVKDFKSDYNAYNGNAYGLANTLMQTAFLRPKIKSKKVNNLYFTGQLTVPGPGVPPALISGKIAANKILT